jgi:DNA-binding FadR family transcriptional regulator
MATSAAGREGWVTVDEVVRAPKAAEIIANSIRRRIVLGELTEGDTLPSESELMGQFGVSRPTLREAFRIMEAESLISIRRGSRGGAQVMAPDPAVAARYMGILLQMRGTTIGEVHDSRLLIESAAVHLLATRRRQRDLTELRAVADSLRELADTAKDDPTTSLAPVTTLTRRFRELLLDRAGNRALAAEWGVLGDVMETHRAVVSRNRDHTENPDSLRRTARACARLLTLLEAKDAEGAQSHWRAYLEAAGKTLIGTRTDARAVLDLFD